MPRKPQSKRVLPIWKKAQKDHPNNGFGGPNSTIVVYKDPPGMQIDASNLAAQLRGLPLWPLLSRVTPMNPKS